MTNRTFSQIPARYVSKISATTKTQGNKKYQKNIPSFSFAENSEPTTDQEKPIKQSKHQSKTRKKLSSG